MNYLRHFICCTALMLTLALMTRYIAFGTRTMRDCHAAEWTVAEPRDTYWRRLHQNLLTAIFTFGRFVIDELDPEDAIYGDMQEVLRAADKAAELTSQLLAFSRLRPVSPRVLNVNDVVEGIDRMLRRIVGEDVDVADGDHAGDQPDECAMAVGALPSDGEQEDAEDRPVKKRPVAIHDLDERSELHGEDRDDGGKQAPEAGRGARHEQQVPVARFLADPPAVEVDDARRRQ